MEHLQNLIMMLLFYGLKYIIVPYIDILHIMLCINAYGMILIIGCRFLGRGEILSCDNMECAVI